MVYFNVYGFIDLNNDDNLFRAPDAPRKRQKAKPDNPRVLPDIHMNIRAPPCSRKILFPALGHRTPPRAQKRQRTRKAPVQNKKLSAVCRSLFREELTDQTNFVRATPVPSVYRKLQLLCQDMDNTNTNKDLITGQQDTTQQFAGAQDFLLHDMQILDAAEQQRTPEAGSLNKCSDDKEKHAMASVHYDSNDEEEHDLSAMFDDVPME